MMINSKTRLLGVIGAPIAHSLSPELHNYIFQKFNLNYCYHAFQVLPQNLENTISAFKVLNFRGINVTIPYKESVLKYMDELSEAALNLGAVNTIQFRINGKLAGYNTDGTGFLKSLGKFREKLKGETALILGAGGSARAVIFALIKDGIGAIRIYNRTLINGQKTTEFIKVRCGFQNISAHALCAEDLSHSLQAAALLVNTTPVGMTPGDEHCPIGENVPIPSGILVVDLIYNPLETRLLKKARGAGANIINGLDMLIYQGLESLQIWTNLIFDEGRLLPELRSHLKRRLMENA